ncbi:MAG: polysaccharide deacetylase family protein [Bacillaceae bacterium]
MVYFYSSNIKEVKKWSLIITLAFVTAWILFIYSFSFKHTFKVGLENAIFYKGSNTHKQIALTFEVEKGTSILASILHILEKEKIHNATFFLNGRWAEENPNLVAKILKNGHEIGTMGYTSQSYEGKTSEEIKEDLTKATTILKKLGVKSIQFVRPPQGYYDKTVIKAVTAEQYTIVHWSIQSMDTQNINAAKITENTTSNIENGDVISLHASDYSLQTKKALPSILKIIKEKGYTQASISELISNTKAKSKVVN